MNVIYEEATEVWVWLGLDDEDTPYIVEKLEEFYSCHKERIQLVDNGGIVLKDASSENYAIFCILSETMHTNLRQRITFFKFFSLPWWTRTWTQQESTTKAPTTFIWGNYEIPRLHLLAIADLFHDIQRARGYKVMNDLIPFAAANLEIFLERQKKDFGMELIRVLGHFRNLRATDPRDKVYAALHLATDMQAGDIRVDYTLPMYEVYIDVAKFSLERKRSLDWLGEAGRTSVFGLPSWAPDWSIMSKQAPPSLPKEMRGPSNEVQPVYHADTALSEKLASDYALEIGIIDGKLLRLRGFCVDIVETVQAVHITYEGAIEPSWLPKQPFCLYPPTRETMRVAFSRTVTADVVISNGLVISRRGLMGKDPSFPFEWPEETFYSINILGIMRTMTIGRRFATTRLHGFIGLIPELAKVGDLVFVLRGGQDLYILRKAEAAYSLIGECYIHGIMDGEAKPIDGCEPGVVILE
jgi:hypothetical protein